MRIGIDAACWANKRGYGRYARELVTAMCDLAPDAEFVCFLDQRALDAFELDRPNVRPVLVPQAISPTEAAVAGGSRSPLDMLRFTRAVARESLDVFFSPSVYTFFPLPPGLRAVVCIHDAIAERFPELTMPSRRARLFWNAKVALALRQARLVLTVSEYARDEIIRVLGVDPRRMRVAVEAPADAFEPRADEDIVAEAARTAGLPKGASWFTYVGGFNPHKNVRDIVTAHARLASELGDAAPHLVLVGSHHSDGFYGDFEEVTNAVEEAGTGRIVHAPGFLPDADLASLHSASLGLLLVSESEGFGLPAVEAAACGSPVIATTESPLPQLLDGGGWFVEPGDVDGIHAAMRCSATDHEERLKRATAARSKVGELGWPAAAGAALEALTQAAR